MSNKAMSFVLWCLSTAAFFFLNDPLLALVGLTMFLLVRAEPDEL
jgi:hypothetical protein